MTFTKYQFNNFCYWPSNPKKIVEFIGGSYLASKPDLTYKRFINFECDFKTFYRVHFYSRLAFRFYREIASFNCYDKQSLYDGVRDSFDWLTWLHFDKTFNVQVTGRTSSLSHTHFTALEVKNSITDLQQAFWYWSRWCDFYRRT